MPIQAPDDARPGTGRCFMRQTATGEKRRDFAEVHVYILHLHRYLTSKDQKHKYKNIYFA